MTTYYQNICSDLLETQPQNAILPNVIEMEEFDIFSKIFTLFLLFRKATAKQERILFFYYFYLIGKLTFMNNLS